MDIKRYWRNLYSLDWVLLITFLILIILGLVAIYSVELSHHSTDFLNLKKQLLALVIGLVLFFMIAFSNYKMLRNYSVLLYIIGVLLMVGVLFFGVKVRGTIGWFNFGIWRFQPVELMKVILTISLASYFSQRARRKFSWREFFESGLMVLLPAGLTFLQPDLGSALLMIGTWLVVIFMAGISKKMMIILLIGFVLLSFLSWNFLLADYQKARVNTFINPELDPLGEGYNVTQAIIAVGAGGFLGSGLGFGTQSQLKFLPESQTDFIFAEVAEELGFLGISLLLGLFLLLFYRLYLLAYKVQDNFTSFLIIAIIGLIFVQFLINTGMNLGVVPVTGVTLPFVSYGGSSLLLTLVMMGIVESAVIRSRLSLSII